MPGSVATVSALACAVLAAATLGACSRPEPAPTPHTPAQSCERSRSEWATAFASRGAVGTFVLSDERSGCLDVFDPTRAARRTTPASTFKVYNALVAIESGVVRDPDSLFVWDGVERFLPSWNEDQSLRDGLRRSTVWLFQRIADAVGRNRYATYFRVAPYGSGVDARSIGPDLRTFWLDGSLTISAMEQVGFLERLIRGETGFSPQTEATVRDLMPVLADTLGVRLVGKTGWGLREGEPDVGWLVGWVERPQGVLVYALNAEPDGPDSPFSFGDRLAIVRDLLSREGVLPSAER